MEVFRLCLKHQAALDGEGARLYGGRWNTAGCPLIYTSQSFSLAVLEYLVHVELDNLPSNLIWLKIHLPDNAIESFSSNIAPPQSETSSFGDQWLKHGKALALKVPSAISPVESNLLINPRHSKMSQVKILDKQPFVFDQRLFKR